MNTSTPKNIHLFGIRHHGPGSAHALRQALTELKPDIVLVEGPLDANGVVELLGRDTMEPPVSLLVYRPDQPKQAAYFPMAVFSPEYQAITYALSAATPVRFIDFPQAHRFALNELARQQSQLEPQTPTADHRPPTADLPSPTAEAMKALAQAAGFEDHESWWNQMIEQRRDSKDIFAAIFEVMAAVRSDAESRRTDGPPTGKELFEARREAQMRTSIRKAQAEGHGRIAVVCGAWHTPALVDLDTAERDAQLLQDLPRVKVEATWVPWTYGRLSYFSGYGAGIHSPGWYEHLWHMSEAGNTPTESSIHWLTQVARLLRSEGLDASSAQVIDAVRLAEALSTMRQRALPGLAELNEVAQTVLSFGDRVPMQLIEKKLIIGERMGEVPPDTPMVPLQRDLYRLQKRLKLRPEPEPSNLKLDLRKGMHLERSHLLHRLLLLNIPWGYTQKVRARQGTFSEVWRLQWRPDFAVQIIEASMWGNTVEDAAVEFARDLADKAQTLPALTELLNRIILAELPETVAHVMQRIEETAAVSNDVPLMMDALPPLALILRYGNVRQSNSHMIRQVVDGLLTRICIGLPNACASLNNDAAEEMFKRVTAVNGVVNTLQNEEHKAQWHAVLERLIKTPNLHGTLAGRACRLLLDGGVMTKKEVGQRMRLALSGVKSSTLPPPAAKPRPQPMGAFWLEGFLTGSGLLLMHDHELFQLLDEWVTELKSENFVDILPLLRRTFASFPQAERRQIGEQVRRGPIEQPAEETAEFEEDFDNFDRERAEQVLPLIAQLLKV